MSCAIFDVDGTLVDSNDAHADAWADAFAEHGVKIDRALVRRCIGMGGDKLMPRVSGIQEESAAGQRISSRRAEIFKTRYLQTVRAFPRVPDLLARLKNEGLTLAVATSARRSELGALLEKTGAERFFDAFTSSDDADESKPDPDIVTAALQKGHCDRLSSVMIGDTPYDIEAAHRAGVRAIAVRSGGWDTPDLRGAVDVFEDVAEMLAAFDTRMRPLFGK